MEVDLKQLKAQLDAILERFAAGEEIVITRNGMPYAKVTPTAEQPAHPPHVNGSSKKWPSRQPGWAKGIITHISPDFDEPLEDFKEYMG